MSNSDVYVLGLAGPVGSGCTTIANFFDDCVDRDKLSAENSLLKHLERQGYFKHNKEGRYVINDNKWDKQIENYLSEIEKIKQEENGVSKEAEFVALPDFKQRKANVFKKLESLLEKRETLKSLDELDDYFFPKDTDEEYKDKKHCFRSLSMSDLIIFRILLCLDESHQDNWKGYKAYKEKDKELTAGTLEKIIKDKLIGINQGKEELYKSNIIKRKDPFLQQFYQKVKLFSDEDRKSDNEDIPILSNFLYVLLTLSHDIKRELTKYSSYRFLMQDFGDNTRAKGNPLNFKTIDILYSGDKESLKNNKDLLAQDAEIIINFLAKHRGHSFFVIDCFRNPYEVLYLRKKFINFYLVSVYADYATRKERIKKKFEGDGFVFDGKFFDDGEKRDQGKSVEEDYDVLFKQDVPSCVKISDISINNDGTKDDLYDKLLRYLALIFDKGCTKPSDDEVYMNMAYTMAMKSNCLCRQVGAVIVKDGYVVGAGFNDVGPGQISCGLRAIKDLERPHYNAYVNVLKVDLAKEVVPRIKKKLGGSDDFCFCFKDELSDISNDMLNDSERTTLQQVLSNDSRLFSKIKKRFETSSNLLQYCKSLHAEENAIIQGSKIGGMGLKGSLIYTTSFPCELCAKKIHQMELDGVVYTEPYPGISEQMYLQDGIYQVSTRHFEGVMPYAYCRLFKVDLDQKEWQRLKNFDLVK